MVELALKKLPDDLYAISESAFEFCYSLELESLPSNLGYIGPHAFFGCTSLALKALPDRQAPPMSRRPRHEVLDAVLGESAATKVGVLALVDA